MLTYRTSVDIISLQFFLEKILQHQGNFGDIEVCGMTQKKVPYLENLAYKQNVNGQIQNT